jgi:hypothetical protein
MNTTVGITPKQYLAHAFPSDLLLPGEAPVVAFPDSFTSRETGKRVDYYRQFHPRNRLTPGAQAFYFCVSTVERQRKRQVKKRLEDVRSAFVLALDDIGTKSREPGVEPSAVIETSAKNYQFHYFLEPFDVSTPAAQAYYDACCYSLGVAQLSDPGMRSATRLARLPGSLHRTGFISRAVVWAHSRSWELPALMEELGVEVSEPRVKQALRPGKYTDLADVDDRIYDWLVANNKVLGHNDQWVFIECPWRADHTDGLQGPTSTAYSPDDYGRAGVGFKCLHGHCADRGVDDFHTWCFREMNT